MRPQRATDSIGRPGGNESSNEDLSRLAEFAREAYEQKRMKDCLDLTRAILLIDPGNADALWMRSSIQQEMQRDLENARAVLQHAHFSENPESELKPGEPPVLPAPDSASDIQGLDPQVSSEALPTPADPAPSRRMPRGAWVVGASLAIIFAGWIASFPSLRTKTNSVDPPVLASAEPDASKPVLNVAATQPDPPLLNPEAEKPRDPAPAPSSRAAATLPDKPAVPAAPGILAVSSPTSVDIYKDQAYLGSVPVSLELPAGMHALEYRHGSLRRIVTHVINSNETTRAMITFEVSVQINSRPWAEVFLDGLERKPLGQTPLSGVRVPIGGVLLFENPQFEPKRYRVTGNETGIQVVFP